MFASWFQQQAEDQYWLVDYQVHKEALQQNGSIGFEDSIPLFDGAMFADVMSLSPWLIPVSKSVSLLPESLLGKGLVLSSSESSQSVLDHLRSLLIAALEGEEVLFRFYDRQVIIPMLTRMDEIEKNQFLGNISHLAAFDNQEQPQFVTFTNTSNTQFSAHGTTWWVVKPHHLESSDDLSLIQTNLESWLWQHYPDTMNEHLAQGRDVSSILTPFLAVSEQTLTYRVMSAAIVGIVGPEQLAQHNMIEFLQEYENEEVQFALHALTRQFEQEG
ncbi:DUF4123 domain-containing protein [Vibrio hepatarius]|uniref:DUF4123 domain-containing protein n=1 Tax=Vibrio hepatarius TaxID=171383 RepID=UPI0037364FC1